MADLLFGLNVSTSAAPGADPVGYAKAAEDLGFDFVSSSDHPSGDHPTFETWTLLSWIAACTSRIRVATRVLGVPYRSPAMVAKMAESLDRLSGGRLILGLGGGSADHEFRAFGLGVPTAGEKIDGLADAVRIARGLWSEPAFTYDGKVYRTDAAPMEPKPGHHIPIWLGTFGPRALALTGELADGWIPSLGFAPPEQIPEMRDRVMDAAARAGRGPSDITCAYNVVVHVGDHPDAGPTMVSGPASAVAERLAGFLELGFTALNLMPIEDEDPAQPELLAREVLPEVRAAA